MKRIHKGLMVCVGIALLLLVCGCKKQDPSPEITFSAGETAPFFTSGDRALYPILGELPTEQECIKKDITVLFRHAKTVTVSLEFESDLTVEGLRYSVNGWDGAPVTFSEIFTHEANGEESVTFTLAFWLDKTTPDSAQGKVFAFTLCAKAE